MKIKEKTYKDTKLRFIEILENGLLLNTKDFCKILKISERELNSELSSPSLDLVSAINITLSEQDKEFSEWLIMSFDGYDRETLIRPNSDDDWNFNLK